MWRLPGRPLRAPLCRVGRDWLADPSLGSAPWGSPRDLEPPATPTPEAGCAGQGRLAGRGPVSSYPHLWTRLLPAGGKGLDGPAHAHLAAQTCRRPLPQLRKERQSPPWQKFENPEIKKPRRTRPLRNRGSLCSDLPACRRNMSECTWHACTHGREKPSVPPACLARWAKAGRPWVLEWSRGLSHTASATHTWVERFCSFEYFPALGPVDSSVRM